MIQITRDFDLSSLNTMGLKSTAEAAVEVMQRSELVEIYDQLGAFEKWQILGGGSNLILAPRIGGLTLIMRNSGRRVSSGQDEILIEVEAGENWHHFVEWTIQQGYGGLENLALIPGTVGASPIQNIGAYGVEMKDFCRSVTAFDFVCKEFVKIPAEECRFSYRDSKFKGEWKKKYIVVAVEFALPTNWKPRLTYPELIKEIQQSRYANDQVSAKDVLSAIIRIRKRKLPDPKTTGNVGSFFKNPIVSQQVADRLVQRFPGMPCHPTNHEEQRKLSAAWLIEKCGLKGFSRGGMQVSTQHSLVLINQERATLQDVAELTQAIQSEVRSQFHIELETEPQFWMS
jgi:UDP-N-acetylmuramate dehydrogenase